MLASNRNYFKYSLSLAALVLAVSCSPDNNFEKRKEQLTKLDESLLPKSMSLVDGQSLELDKIKMDVYKDGCETVGSAQPNLQLHPKLKAGDIYVVKNLKVQGSKRFNMSYEVSLKQLPSVSSDIILSGQLSDVELSNYTKEVLNLSNASVEKKCSLVSSPSAAEKCEDILVDYSPEFIEAYNNVFKDDVNCQYGATDVPTKEKWQEGRYLLSSGKAIKVYIHSLQTRLNRICAGEKQAKQVTKTVVKALSNHVVSPYRSHCGGELIFDKTIVRDHVSNEILSLETYELSLAPIATVGQ